MDRRESSEGIDQAAAQWVARMDRGPLPASEKRRLQGWLAGDARRRGAFLRAKAVWMASEPAGALGARYDPAEFPAAASVSPPPRVASRHRLLQWSGAVAASLVLAVFLAVGLLQAPIAYATVKGEMRMVHLAGGSTITLNTDSRVKVYDDGGWPRVRVLKGEVFFEAVGTGGRLTVEVDGRRFQAAAAAFAVRKLGGRPAQVLVQGGRVELPASRTQAATVLDANTRVSLPAGEDRAAHVALLSPDQVARELAWREGKIAFLGESLSEAASAFARYHDTRIVIADPDLANAPVTGLFAANNPVGFAQAVAEVFDAQVRRERDRVVVAPGR